MAYTDATEIGNKLGITIGSGTTPSTTNLTAMLTSADGLINGEVRVTSNMSDDYGELKQIATDLVLRMIRNLWSFRNPDVYPYETVELLPSQIRIIHRVHLKFSGTTWDPYETGSQV